MVYQASVMLIYTIYDIIRIYTLYIKASSTLFKAIHQNIT